MVIKFKGLSMAQSAHLLPDNLILLGYRGSIAHEMYVPNTDPLSIDDKDVMGVFAGPRAHYLGFGRNEDWEKMQDPWDIVCYELRKYIRLLLKSNPNVLSLLWLKPGYYIEKTEAGQRLIDNRDLFVSKAAYHSFTGYAHSQLKRMTSFAYQGYMGAKRKALVETFGYDTKNASHLIRLLRMGIEFLTDGELHVAREDAQELLAIKHGKWTLSQVQNEADRLFRVAEQAFIHSSLPPKPDREGAERLLMGILEQKGTE